MKQIPIWACLFSLFLLLHQAKSDEERIRDVLLEFMFKLSNSNDITDPSSGWNSSSYPCKDRWRGINCDDQHLQVKEIVLDGFDFAGIFDARIICNTQSLSSSILVINLTNNSIHGENLEDIQNCFQLTELFIGQNQFSGLPESISRQKNLKILDISSNGISGSLPNLSQIDGLIVFRAQENKFSGPIPNLDFSSFSEFNVSYNNLTGPIPTGAQRVKLSSFIHNPHLCGPPLPNNCTSIKLASSETAPAPPPPGSKQGGVSNYQILMYSGYILIGLTILFFILLCLYRRGKTKQEKIDADNNKVAAINDSMMTKPSFSTVELEGGLMSKNDASKTNCSTASMESVQVSSSLVVLTSPDVNGLRFEDLLKAPAELLGRGNHGRVYKVVCGAQGTTLAVKRIKDWTISSDVFRQRMRRLNQVKHPNVLPAVAYYCSRQEKLLVYEYQQNGSLFRLIHAHGNESRQPLDWSSRLSFAATIADALAFMHEELHYDRIPHGNLKSSKILINNDMEPCISEYGLMLDENQEQQPILSNRALQAAQEGYQFIFKKDTYSFGVILLELLTGRTALTEGLDLGSWVLAAVREEWTVEVFDTNLILEGTKEERMVNMLQIAIKCVNKSLESRPTMKQVALAIRAIRDDDERSMDASELSMSRSFVDLQQKIV